MKVEDLVKSDKMLSRVDWHVEITYSENRYVVAWVEYASKETGHPFGNWLMAYKNGEELSDFSTEGRTIRNAAVSLRSSEVRSEYDDRVKYDFSLLKETVLDIFNRHQRGEYVGQFTGMLYTATVANILNVSEDQIFNAVSVLRFEEKVGLSGFILIPFEQDENNRQYLEEISGHKDFDRSDFGDWWTCRACGNHGDWVEGSMPEDFPCTP